MTVYTEVRVVDYVLYPPSYGKICVSDMWKDIEKVFMIKAGDWCTVSLVNVAVGDTWKGLVN